MKPCIALLLIILLGNTSNCQTVFNASGTTTTSGTLVLDWSFGEPCIQSTKTDFIWSTEGLLQPNNGSTQTLPQSLGTLPVITNVGLDNAGTSFANTSNGSNLMIEFTFGETASLTLINGNKMVTQGILQPFLLALNAPLPVSGLEFSAKRLNALQVLLDWKTLQELNNKGFAIERKREKEAVFSEQRFVQSKAPGGISTSMLTYQQLDTNQYAARTWYRLKQVDENGKWTYSMIRLVSGNTEKTAVLNVWPIPAVSEFSVSMSGESSDVILVFDASGRLVKQVPVQEGKVVKIAGLIPGHYLLKLKSSLDLSQKVIVQ